MTNGKTAIDFDSREALISVPEKAKTEPTPVVFGFHGHGGSMKNAARSFRYQELWPEAIVVYMQGLKTPGQLTDPEGLRAGRQSHAVSIENRKPCHYTHHQSRPQVSG